MILTARSTLAIVLMLLPAGTVRAQSSVDSTLRTVQALYAGGAYTQAELEGRRLLDNELLSDSLRIVVEQWVAFSLVAQGQPVLAREHFLVILHRQPTYDLDPILTSPKILTVFNEARAAFRASRPSPAGSTPEREMYEGISFRTVLFPGWEQLYQGRTTTGAIFLGAGIASLGTGIALEFVRQDARNEYLAATSPDDIEAKYQTYNRVKKAEVWAFGIFAAVYIASEVDVFANTPPVSLSLRPSGSSTPGTALSLIFHMR